MTTTRRSDVWDLDDDPSWLTTAESGWQSLVSSSITASSTTTSVRGRVKGAWEGDLAEGYLTYAPKVTAGLDELAEMAAQVKTTLGSIHDVVSQLRVDLSASYTRATSGMTSVRRGGGFVTFEYPDDEERPQIDREHGHAGELVEGAREDIRAHKSALDRVASAADDLSLAWHGPATGSPGWEVPVGSGFAPMQTTLGDTTTVTTGAGPTSVSISVDPETGETILTITYNTDSQCVVKTLRIPAGQNVVINTGGGSDVIRVGPGVDVDVRLTTGGGADTVQAQETGARIEAFGGSEDDTVETSGGHDFVDGGAGNDYVDSGGGADRIFGGTGNDILYGMDGVDTISGGSGHDYLEGAEGEDLIFGDGGDDTISGGFGDDTMFGGLGDDTMYAGSGTDTLDGGSGDNKFTVEEGDSTVGSGTRVVVEIPSEEYYTQWLEFEVDGSEAFKARMLADLQMLASSEAGQAMIEAQIRNYEESGGLFGLGKEKVTFIEMSEPNGYATPDGDIQINPDFRMGIANTSPEAGTHTHTPPVVILFHELGHINQLRTQGDTFGHWWDPDAVKADGTRGDWIRDENGQPLIERQNVGLDWDTALVPEGDGDSYDYTLTENGFREEIRIPPRERY